MSFDENKLSEVLESIDKESKEQRKLKEKSKPKRVVERVVMPWEELCDEKYSWFIEEVNHEFNIEQRKDKGRVKCYIDVMKEVWERGNWLE